MPTAKAISYGQPTLVEKIGVCASILLHLPLVLAWTLLTSPFHHVNRHKNWKRVIGDKALYHIWERFNTSQLQWMLGTSESLGAYETWAKANKLPVVVDELGKEGRLFWISERRNDKVILFLHGGGYVLPLADFAMSFWKHVKDELKKKDKHVGIAMLNYSLAPTAGFPTQLTQAVLAVQYLLANDIDPQNIQLVGDSAGGNLILQLISHVLHPIPAVPPLTLSRPLAGAYLMSPWVSLTYELGMGSITAYDGSDIIGPQAIATCTRIALDGLPNSAIPYINPLKAPERWWDGIAQVVVDRVLVTVGGAECLKDDIVRFGQRMCEVHRSARMILHEFGVHEDPHLDFMWGKDGERKIGAVTPLIVGWLADGWKN